MMMPCDVQTTTTVQATIVRSGNVELQPVFLSGASEKVCSLSFLLLVFPLLSFPFHPNVNEITKGLTRKGNRDAW